MNKKGDVSAAQIITIILVIIGFAIVALWFYLVNFGGYTDKDICKLSVLTRATSPGVAQSLVPLKCKAQKICITETSKKDSCKGVNEFAGEEDIVYVNLKGNVEDKREIIESTNADAMYDCWSRMGEGKLDLFGSLEKNLGFGSVTSSCVVCSRVVIDKSVGDDVLYTTDKDGKKVSAIDVKDYMKSQQIPGQSLTYLQALTDKGVNAYSNPAPESPDAENKGEIQVSGTNQLAYVFMQIKSDSVGDVLTNQLYAGGTIAGAVLLSPAKNILAFIGGKFVLIGTAVIAATTASVGTINALEGQKVAGAYCGKFTSSKEKAEEGCSIVQGMMYDAEILNKLCVTKEGEL